MIIQHTTKRESLILRTVFSIGVTLAAAWVLVTHWQVVQSGVQVASGAQAGWFACSLVLTAITFGIAAATYCVLALRRLRYGQTVLVELSAAFVNRLLPSGLGGLGLHGVYLFKRKHSVAEATVVVSVNNLVGMAAHVALLAVVFVFAPDIMGDLFASLGLDVSWVAGVVAVGVVISLYLIPAVRKRLRSFIRNLLVSIRKVTVWQLGSALVLATVLTLTYTLVLICSARSVGLTLGAVQLFVVFTVGMLAATATPTPGGLVGAEAGLYAAMSAYGVSPTQAAATVVLFRLATYWIPLLPGLLSFFVARRTHIV